MSNLIIKEGYVWFRKKKPPITVEMLVSIITAFHLRKSLDEMFQETGIPLDDLYAILKGEREKEKEKKEDDEDVKKDKRKRRRTFFAQPEIEYIKRVYAERSIPIRTLSKIMGMNHCRFEYTLWKLGVWRREKRRWNIDKKDPPKHWNYWMRREYKKYYDTLIEIKKQNDKLKEEQDG